MPAKPEILLIGPGAIGVYFCGRLAQAGAAVSVIARGDHDAVVGEGYQIKSPAGDFRFRPRGVYRRAADFPGTPDWIVAATKVLPEIDLPVMLRDAVRAPSTRILLIQNGIGIEKPVAEAFPDNPVYSAIAYIGVARTAPGHVHHQDGGRLTFGRFGDLPPDDAANLLCDLFNRTGVDAKTVDNINHFRWQKLLWNVPFNSISVAAGGRDTREILDHPDLEALCRDLMAEVAEAAALAGVRLTPEMMEANMAYTRTFVAYKTSMLLDYEAGRPMEVEAIIGNVVALARSRNVRLPKIETILALLRALNRHRA